MAVVAVRANPEHLRTPLLKVSHRVAHRAELALAHVREVPDVERQDHGPLPSSFERVTGFPSSLSTVKSGACWPTSTIWGTAAAERPAGDNPFASTPREAAAAAERNVYLTDGTNSGPRLSKGIAEPDQTHQIGGSRVGGRNGEVRARRGLHTDDGLPQRPSGHVLQLHSDGLLAVPPRVPDPGGPAEARRAGPTHPSAVRSPKSGSLPRPGVRAR